MEAGFRHGPACQAATQIIDLGGYRSSYVGHRLAGVAILYASAAGAALCHFHEGPACAGGATMPCPATVGKLPNTIGESRRVRITEATLPRPGSICANSLKNRGLGSGLGGHGILRAAGFETIAQTRRHNCDRRHSPDKETPPVSVFGVPLARRRFLLLK